MKTLKTRRWSKRLFRPAVPLMRHAGHLLLWYVQRLSPDQSERVLQWRALSPGERLRYEYALRPGSVVVDAGGYLGDFATEITARYHAKVYVYEPIPEYCQTIEQRLGANPNIKIVCAGLGDADEHIPMSIAGESTSAHQGTADTTAQIRAFDTEMNRLGIQHIDLLKINIEGGEYALLDHLIATGWIDRIGDLQVQFHDFVPDAHAKRDRLRKQLCKTHETTYCVPFVWENWHRSAATESCGIAA